MFLVILGYYEVLNTFLEINFICMQIVCLNYEFSLFFIYNQLITNTLQQE